MPASAWMRADARRSSRSHARRDCRASDVGVDRDAGRSRSASTGTNGSSSSRYTPSSRPRASASSQRRRELRPGGRRARRRSRAVRGGQRVERHLLHALARSTSSRAPRGSLRARAPGPPSRGSTGGVEHVAGEHRVVLDAAQVPAAARQHDGQHLQVVPRLGDRSVLDTAEHVASVGPGAPSGRRQRPARLRAGGARPAPASPVRRALACRRGPASAHDPAWRGDDGEGERHRACTAAPRRRRRPARTRSGRPREVAGQRLSRRARRRTA